MLINSSVLLANAGVWYAFAHSDAMGKGIVFLLFISSMVAWFIMIEKWLVLYRAQKLSERFAVHFNNQHGMNSMLRDGMENPCPVARVYISGMEQLLEFYGQTAEEVRSNAPMREGHGPRKLSPAQLDAVQTAMEREISSQIFVIEERIGMLATAVSLAPFLGLFGTVWGVMIAFCGVASAGSANIQALAPGVAGALLTTVAGLVVAIPSLVGYNFLTQMIRKITVSMDNFSESFMARLKLEQLVAKEVASCGAGNPASQVGVNTSAAAPQMRPASQIPANVPRPQYAQNQYAQMPQSQAVNPTAPQGYGAAGNQMTGNMQNSAGTGNAYQSRYTYTANNGYNPAAGNTVSQPAGGTVPQSDQMSFESMGSSPDESMKG